jgi:Xaa-Pro dipeptidase
MALLDMGAEYHGYVSDITCSFPVSTSKKFSADQAGVYQGVLNAQRAVLNMMVPGSKWPDCHKAAELEIIKSLQGLGVLKDKFDSQLLAEVGLGAVFFPHGLGHLIGCDTHDVGGYVDGTPERSTLPGLSKLRTARVLEAGMVLTNEPGCYFIDALLDAAIADPEKAVYINNDRLEDFRGFGGVRLEDVVLVNEDGAENLTTCPRTIAEVESVLAGGPWPPAKDDAPWLKRRWTKLGKNGDGMAFLDI